MRNFMRKVALFCIPIAIFMISTEILARNIPNSYKLKDRFIQKNSSKLTTLVLGSSHSFYGIDTDVMPGCALNFANVSQSIDYDEWILKNYIDKLPNLRNVIIPVSYFSLRSNLSKSIEKWRCKNYRIYLGYPAFLPIEYDFEITSDIKSATKQIISYYVHGRTSLDCNESGAGISYTIEKRPSDWQESGITAARRHSRQDDSMEKPNTNRLRNMIALCLRENVQPIILFPPAWKTYTENLDSTQLSNVVTTCVSLSNEFSIPYLNLLTDNRFSENDFYDADHLNTYGAKKLAQLLSAYLK